MVWYAWRAQGEYFVFFSSVRHALFLASLTCKYRFIQVQYGGERARARVGALG